MLLTQFNIALHVDADTVGLVCAGLIATLHWCT